MSKYLLTYARDERVKYISHLDFIRLFHRTVRRSGVEFLYSEGFNPHPIMTVARPLSVGVTAEREYMKVGFKDDFSEKEMMDKINNSFPPGYKLTDLRLLDGKKIDINKIAEAEYTVTAELQDGFCKCDVDKIMAENELVVMKKSKSGIKESDIKSYLYKLEEIEKSENIVTYKMRVSCSNEYNLKPETVISAMEKYDEKFKTSFICVHRNRLILP